VKSLILHVVALATLFASVAVADDSKKPLWKDHATLSSDDFRAIEAAFPEVARRRPNWKNFSIGVTETDNSLLISFWKPEDADTIIVTRGGQGEGQSPARVIATIPRNHDELVVELDKSTLRILDVENVR